MNGRRSCKAKNWEGNGLNLGAGKGLSQWILCYIQKTFFLWFVYTISIPEMHCLTVHLLYMWDVTLTQQMKDTLGWWQTLKKCLVFSKYLWNIWKKSFASHSKTDISTKLFLWSHKRFSEFCCCLAGAKFCFICFWNVQEQLHIKTNVVSVLKQNNICHFISGKRILLRDEFWKVRLFG